MDALKALIWDVDGVLAETELTGHLVAFNAAFDLNGVPWRWDANRYGELLTITGGKERLLADMAVRSDAPTTADERLNLAQKIHIAKNQIYSVLVEEGRIPLRAGVVEMFDDALSAGLKLGIATTTSRSNLVSLLEKQLGADWGARFSVVVCGEDVGRKKPDPEVYLKALATLKIRPGQAIAIEDSTGGVAAARAAAIPTVVTKSHFFATATLEDAIAMGPGFDQRAGWRPALEADVSGAARVTLEDLREWFKRGESISQYA